MLQQHCSIRIYLLSSTEKSPLDSCIRWLRYNRLSQYRRRSWIIPRVGSSGFSILRDAGVKFSISWLRGTSNKFSPLIQLAFPESSTLVDYNHPSVLKQDLRDVDVTFTGYWLIGTSHVDSTFCCWSCWLWSQIRRRCYRPFHRPDLQYSSREILFSHLTIVELAHPTKIRDSIVASVGCGVVGFLWAVYVAKLFRRPVLQGSNLRSRSYIFQLFFNRLK